MTEDSQLRFAAAALAMQGIASSSNGWVNLSDASEIAKRSVALADALLLELQKPRPTV